MNTSFFKLTKIAGIIMACGVALPAQASDYIFSTGNYYQGAIGDQIGSGYDIFAVTGLSNIGMDFLPALQTPVVIGNYAFTVGGNCYSCSLTPNYTADILMTIGAQSQHVLLGYSWASTGPTDSLFSSTPAAPVSFLVDPTHLVTVTGLSFGTVSSSGGTVNGNLTATFEVTPVPEADTYAMMLAGLGLVGFMARRRTRAAV